MVLDLQTIYVVFALICMVLGAVQLAVYCSGRFERWSLWWGAGNVLLGGGTFCNGLRDIAPDVVAIALGNCILLSGWTAVLIATRLFAGKPVDIGRYCLATALIALPTLLLWNDRASTPERVAYFSAVFALCSCVILRENLHLATREKLYSAWILTGLYAVSAVFFAVRAVLAGGGSFGGAELFHSGSQAHPWIVLLAVLLVTLFSMTMVLMASERSYKRLIELAHHDPLTGAMNRGGLASFFERIRAADNAEQLFLLIVDIDHFKTLNDTHGHAAGDAMLQLLVSVARAQLRRDDIIARQGGDEFIVILRKTSTEQAVVIADRIRTAFAKAVAGQPGISVLPTLSIGMAHGPSGKGSLESLLQQADEALYRSKREGRNRVTTTFALDRAA